MSGSAATNCFSMRFPKARDIANTPPTLHVPSMNTKKWPERYKKIYKKKIKKDANLENYGKCIIGIYLAPPIMDMANIFNFNIKKKFQNPK